MIKTGRPAFLFGGLALALSLLLGHSDPARAQGPAAALDDFRRTCASEIARKGPNQHLYVDGEFSRILSAFPSIDQIRQWEAELVAAEQTQLAQAPGASSEWREYHLANIEYYRCLARVAMRHAPGGATRPPRVAAAPPAARSSLDGRWVATNLTNPLGYGPEPQLPELTIVSRPGGFQVTSNVARLNGSFVLESEPPGGRRFRRDLPPGTNHSITSTDESPDYLDFCSGGGYCNSFRRVSGARVASRPAATRPVPTPPPAPPFTYASARALLVAGNGVEAVRQLRILADGGDMTSAATVGWIYSGGVPGVPVNHALAVHYSALAANAGMPWAQANYGSFLLQTGHREEGFQWLARAERSGDAGAQWALATIYWHPWGVERDLPRALSLMQRSAAQNYASAVRDLPLLQAALEAEVRGRAAQQVAAAASDPTAGMLPEVAAAWRATTEPVIRARIARNAARYAASRPSLVVRANIGSGCIRPDMINVSFDAARESWDADIRLTNTCNTEQFGYADTQMQNGGIAWMPITNVGMYPGRWDQRRDPAVGFRPYNPLGDAPRYRLPAGGNWASNGGGYPGDGRSNQIELWIGSCPSHAAGNVTQIGFRPAANLRDDPRIACVPGIQGRDGF